MSDTDTPAPPHSYEDGLKWLERDEFDLDLALSILGVSWSWMS